MSSTTTTQVTQSQAGAAPTEPWNSGHLKWLVDTGQRLTTADGKTVEVWELRHSKDDAVLSAWAKHFRNHYCFR